MAASERTVVDEERDSVWLLVLLLVELQLEKTFLLLDFVEIEGLRGEGRAERGDLLRLATMCSAILIQLEGWVCF